MAAKNNPAFYDAVIAGSAGCNAAWLTDPIAADYTGAVNALTALATAVDLAIPVITTGPTQSQIELLTSIVDDIMAGRNIVSTKTSDYTAVAAAIAGLFTQASTALTNQPAIPGMGLPFIGVTQPITNLFNGTGNLSLSAITFGNGIFVGCTNGLGIYTSTDCVTWTRRITSANNWMGACYGVVAGQPLFVIVGATAGLGNHVITSPDGINWTPRNIPVDSILNSVAFGNGVFVAVSQSAGVNTHIFTSPDGINWTNQTTPDNQYTTICYCAALNMFIAGSATAGATNRIITSITNGASWVQQTAQDVNVLAIAATPGNLTSSGAPLIVAVGTTAGAGNHIQISSNGSSWTLRTAPSDQNWQAIVYGNGLFVAFSSSGTNRVMISIDGVFWTPIVTNNDQAWLVNSAVFGNGNTFAASAAASNGTILTMRGI